MGRNNIHLNSRVLALEEKDTNTCLHIGRFREEKKSFDKVLFAIPPSAIQRLRARPTWSPLKEQAIRSAHEGPLYKMRIHFRRRFWETLSEPSFGGQDQTDLRIRWVVYPSQDIRTDNSGCLVVYCGMTDALRWGWMEKAERLKPILEDLNTIFEPRGVNVYEEYLEYFDARWPSEHTFSNTMYYRGQYTRFHEAMAEPEGHAYFAGEHISIHHTWIAGSVESAHEAVKKILADASLPRLGDTSHLDVGPVRLGWQVAAGIPLASSASSLEPAVAIRSPDDKTALDFKSMAHALPQAKLISAFVNDIRNIANGPADTTIKKLDTPTIVAG